VKKRCPVKYSRRNCVPFETSIEGAQCVLQEGHTGHHAAKIVAKFGETPKEDVHEIFRFEAL
jgi:hypothetical protein